jgi:hypothetical protein
MALRRTGAQWFGVGLATPLLVSGTYGVYFTDMYKHLSSSTAAMKQMAGVTVALWLGATVFFLAGAWLTRSAPTPMRAGLAGVVVAVLTLYINSVVLFLKIPLAHAGWASFMIIAIASFLAPKFASLGSPPNMNAVA